MQIVVPSCSKFSDTWSPWIQCWKRFWPDCPYHATLLTDGAPQKVDGFKYTITFSEDLGWCRNIRAYLESELERQFILLHMDDMWLSSPVDNAFVSQAVGWLAKNPGIAAFRLYPAPPCPEDGKLFGPVPKGTPYRVSAAPTIWRRDELILALGSHRTAWEFEFGATALWESAWKEIVAVRGDMRPYPVIYTAITRGRWTKGVLDWTRREGIAVETGWRRECD